MKSPSPREKIEKILRKYFPDMDGEGMFSLILELEEVEQGAEKRAFEKGRKEGVDVAERMAKVAILAREAAYKDKLRAKIAPMFDDSEYPNPEKSEGYDKAKKYFLHLLDEGE